jgi:hypothetical protein
MAAEYPCPGCGFLVFGEPPGSFAICPVCGWENDNVQFEDPHFWGGANGISLAEHRQGVVSRFPPSVREHGGFRRDPGWSAPANES